MSTDPFEGREELITEFWSRVRRRLTEHHKRSPEEADFGIGRYRWDTERRGVRDTTYNQGIERTAQIVDGVIQHRQPERELFE